MSSSKEPLTYKEAGVDYDPIDAFKRKVQAAAGRLSLNPSTPDGDVFTFDEASRGESAAVIRSLFGATGFALVDEGLGTKSLVADACGNELGVRTSYYDVLAQDAVAMAVNDLITIGALPVALTMHLQVASGDWFRDEQRVDELIEGWMQACRGANAPLVAGETPVLSGIIVPGAASLSSTACGSLGDREPLSGKKIKPGDRIVLISGTGVHANGLTLCRKLADKLPDGYKTVIQQAEGWHGAPLFYGEALLSATPIYVMLMRACLQTFRDGELRYGINITGHGWRKLMRATEPFAYVIDAVPEVQPVFRFIQQQAGLDNREMYGTFNMGAGFALIVDPSISNAVVDLAYQCNFTAMDAGEVCTSVDGRRRVIIKPIGVTYEEDSLRVR